MKKRFFQVKIIRRYLFSYLLLFFLPLIVLNGFFHFYYQKSLQNELVQNQQALLEKLQLSTESELERLRLISSQLTLNGFGSDIPLSDPVKGMGLIRFLATQKNVNPFLSDIVIYYKESEVFYSTTSSYTKEYFQLLFEGQPEIFQDLTVFFDSPDRLYTAPPSILLPPATSAKRNLALVYPVAPNGLDTTALLFFFFSSDKLEDICAQYYDPASTTVLLTNQDGELLSAYGDEASFLTDTGFSAENLENASSDYQIIKIEDQQYLITSAHSDSLNWNYLAYTEINSAMASSIALRNIQLLFTLLIILAGGFLILLCMYYNFLPLYRLINLASGLSVPLQNSFHNELDKITGMLSQLFTENTKLNSRLENTKTAAKEYIISQLITGHSLKREYLEVSVVKTILSPHYDNYAVFTVHSAQNSPMLEDTRTELIEEIEAFSSKDIVFLCKEDHAINTFVCIILMNHHVTPQLSSILGTMKNSLSAFMNGSLSIGVGNTYDLMDSLSKSYIEARTALDYRFIRGNNAVIFFSSVKDSMQGSASAYPYTKIQQFSAALSSGNTEALEDSLNGILSCLSREDTDLFQAKCICQDMIRIIAKILPDMQTDDTENAVLPDIFLVSQFETVEDIVSTIKPLGYLICKRMNASYDDNNQILIENIRSFIQEKGCDPGFSQEMLAAHFHMAASNLSAFYKEHTGENINNTVTRLRMERACLLLSTTTLSINQIALNVGYDNVSSFIRRFKQIYHMPPGAWREMQSRQKT